MAIRTIGHSAYLKISEVALKQSSRNLYNTVNRMSISPFLSVQGRCEDALQWIRNQLAQAGLHVVQTFDLHTARAGMHPCTCPNHGTEDCDCQMIVVQVYGKREEPITLILHGNDGQTWLSMAETPPQKHDVTLSTEVRQALERAHGSVSRLG